MIPKNISKEAVLKAMDDIDQNGVPKNRNSTKYWLRDRNKYYPPKYVISLANKYQSGIELKPVDFSGGEEANNFLINLGFQIVDNTSGTKREKNE